jgi:Cu+-exporting ATPase
VGDQRALARPESFGKGAGRDAALVARVAEVVSRWGGLATVGLALSVIAVTNSGGVAAQLCAAGAVLLAAPLLAIRRAAESPLVAASAAAATRGIVYRDANALDLAGRAAVVAMSPNGILTEGQPQVLEVHALEVNMVESLVALAAGAEEAAGSDAVAVAVQEYARRHGVAPVPVRRAAHLAAGGESVLIGNRQLLLDESVSVAAADAAASAAEDQGRTAVFIAVANRVRAVFTLQDSLRPGARAAIQRLLDQRIEIALLTGEQRGSVEKLAADLDIAHIKAGLLPEERAKEVKLLRDAGGKVAAIGRLQVDAAVLAASDISIALDAAGSTAGEYTVMLATDDIRDAAAALWIARAARDGALGATTVAAVAFGSIVAAAATGLIVPAIAATLAVAVDAYGVGAGARLLKRINLRIPI